MAGAPVISRAEVYGAGDAGHTLEASTSGISWPAIIGGAFAAAASSLILLALGSGFGLASVSPWPNSGASAATFTILAAIWLIIVQWLSSGLGGYLTGRLRTKWVGIHTHEVFFRDTAHGLLAWAVAVVIGAAVLASAVSSLLSNGAPGTAPTASAAASQGNTGPLAYDVDSLFRSNHPSANGTDPQIRAEAARILATGMKKNGVTAGDRTYLAELVSAHTGLSQPDAEQRVDAVITRVKAAADAARKAGAYLSIFIGVSLLIGAFVAAVAAALGGRHRDEDWRTDPRAVR